MATGPNSPAQHTAPAASAPATAAAPVPPGANPLGFQQGSLAGVTVDELLKNKTALTMLLHYYHQLHDENGSLKNDLNTAKTYVNGYQTKKVKTRTGATLQAVATLPIGFSINILTGGNDALAAASWSILLIGVVLQGLGMIFAFSGET